MAKDKIVKFRVTEEEYSRLVSKSKYSTVSNVVRNLVFENDTTSCKLKHISCRKNKIGMYVLEFHIDETDETYSYMVQGLPQLIELSKLYKISISDLLMCLDYESSLMETAEVCGNTIYSLKEIEK